MSERTTYLLVDGENIDATLGNSILGRRPRPEERPRWDRLLEWTERAFDQDVTGLFFLAAGTELPTTFVQALIAIGFRPVPLSGAGKVVDIAIQRTAEALVERDADVVLVSHDGDFVDQVSAPVRRHAGRSASSGFSEFVNGAFRGLPGAADHRPRVRHRRLQRRRCRASGSSRSTSSTRSTSSECTGDACTLATDSTRTTFLGMTTRAVGPVIEVRDLRMRYGDKDVLTGVDFTIRPGEVVCLLGPNGAGKTTTIEILEGFRERSAGDGHGARGGPPPRHRGLARPHGRRAAVVARPPAMDAAHAAGPDGRLLRAVRHAGPAATRSRPTSCSTSSGSTDLADQKIATFSGGQRRRLDVAMGIVGSSRAAVPRRTHGGVRPAGAAGVPPPRAPAGRPRAHHDPADHPRPRRGGEARRPRADPGGRTHRRRRHRGAARAAGRDGGRGEVVARRRALRARHRGRDRVRAPRCSPSTGHAVVDLEVRRASLEDAYLDLVQRHEAGQSDEAARAFTEVI